MARPHRLLPRQKAFCDGIAAGLSGTEAARKAGYSESRAAATASRLRAQPAIQAAIQRRLDGWDPDPHFDDPLDFLKWVATNPEGVSSLRVKAAIALLPYFHHKPRKNNP